VDKEVFMEKKDGCTTCLPADAPFDYINTPGARAARDAGLVNLAELPEGGRGVVERISETDHDLDHLVRIGQNPAFIKGLEVTLLAKSPNNGPVIIKVGENLYDVCNDVASVIWVKKQA
jgi:Fe2+ transport system protein FeoA